MPQYHIDEMAGDILTASHVGSADTPLEALQKITSRPAPPRALQQQWVRVVDKQARAIAPACQQLPRVPPGNHAGKRAANPLRRAGAHAADQPWLNPLRRLPPHALWAPGRRARGHASIAARGWRGLN